MLWLGTHLFVIALWAAVFWGAIWLVDRHNPKNSFALAVGLAAIFDFTHAFGVPDLYLQIMWVLFLARLVSWHHNLSIVQTLLVIVLAVFGPMFVARQLVAWIGDSELRDSLVFYGLPVVVFGTRLAFWLRARLRAPEVTDDTGLPQARVERMRRADTQPTPAPEPARAVVAAAPPPPPPRNDDGSPSILS
ncbi:MAG: hypothetical protein ACM31C_33445 [Acidobacteriota bacterium]